MPARLKRAARGPRPAAPGPAELVFANPDLVACILTGLWKDLPSCKGAFLSPQEENKRFKRLFHFLCGTAPRINKTCLAPSRAAIAEFAAALTASLTAYRDATEGYLETHQEEVYAANTNTTTAASVRQARPPPFIPLTDRMPSWTRHSYGREEGDAAWRAFYGECFPAYEFPVGSKKALRQQIWLRIPQSAQELYQVLFGKVYVCRPTHVTASITPSSYARSAFGVWYEHPYHTVELCVDEVLPTNTRRYIAQGVWLPFTDEQYFVDLMFFRRRAYKTKDGWLTHTQADGGLEPGAEKPAQGPFWLHYVTLQYQDGRMRPAEQYCHDVLTGLTMLQFNFNAAIKGLFERRNAYIQQFISKRVRDDGDAVATSFSCRMPIEPFNVALRDPRSKGTLRDASFAEVLGLSSPPSQMRRVAKWAHTLRRGAGVNDPAVKAQRSSAGRLVLREY